MPGETRRLAAIMFTDIAGYTALMGRDEQRALRVLARSRELLARVIPKFNGQLVDHVGDGSLSSFQSAVEAVSCAREIQEALRDDRDLRLRIGIHLGDVLFSGDSVYGDGVNVASRIHALAEPGGICISEKVYDDIRNHPEMQTTFLGEKSLKNVDRPVRVYALTDDAQALAANQHASPPAKRGRWLIGTAIAIALAGAFLVSRHAARIKPAAPSGPSSPTAVAVLPFSVSGGKDFAYLGEGMVTLLSTRLDGAGELRQVDPHSLLSFVAREGGGTVDPDLGRRIAGHFGAGRYVLGSIVAVPGRLHVEASLYEASQNRVAARASVEGDADRVLELVDELAAQLLAEGLSRPGERSLRIGAMTTHSMPALKAFLEGDSHFRSGRFTEAIDAYQRAVAADPSFALAYHWLAYAGGWTSQVELTRTASAQAVRLRDRLPEHDRLLVEALAAFVRGAIDEAERRYRDIIAAYPHDWEAWSWLAATLAMENPFRGRSVSEAREPNQRALSLDPQYLLPLLFLCQLDEAEENWPELAASIEQYLTVDSESDYALVVKALHAFQFGDRGAQERVVAELRRGSDAALGGAAVVQMLHNAGAVEALARLLTEPARSERRRVTGHVQLAHLQLTKGRWGAAKAALAEAARLDESVALEYRALLAAAPFLALSRGELQGIRDEVIRWRPSPGPTSETGEDWFGPHDDIHPQLRSYLVGLLSPPYSPNSRTEGSRSGGAPAER